MASSLASSLGTLENTPNVHTVETAAATIRFTGGASVGSDQSETDSEEEWADCRQTPTKTLSSASSIQSASENKSSTNNPGENHVKINNAAVNAFKEIRDDENEKNFDNFVDPTSSRSSASSSPYDEQLAKMKKNRFNPFDRESSTENEKKNSPVSSPSKNSRPDLPMSESSECSWPDIDTSGTSPASDPDLVTNAELGLAEDHFAHPEGHFGLSSIEELEMAINNCKLLVYESPENSERRKNLVNKLVQLRLKLQEAKEQQEEPVEEEPDIKNVVGHKFKKRTSQSSKHYCEKCSSVIWGVIQAWYRCSGCGFCCHSKCLNLITRTCASVRVAETTSYILNICPDKGLAAQNYRCAECRTNLSYKSGFSEPRQCDYTGAYYCENCHWNDTMIVPGRVIHNWDLEPRKVCRASKQFLRLMAFKPVLRIQDINPMLFSLVEELNDVKKLREEILVMKKYFLSCQAALSSKLLLQLTNRQHFVDSSDMYSLQDLVDVAYDLLLPQLAKIHSSFAQHIKTDCQLCQAKGYVCELCDIQEVLFPFDNIAIVCYQCSTVLHRHCYIRRNQKCPKCDRLSKRAESDPLEESGASAKVDTNPF